MEAEVQVEHDEHESMSTSAEMNDDILPCKDNIIYEALVLSENHSFHIVRLVSVIL
jgi:hypothetical protein